MRILVIALALLGMIATAAVAQRCTTVQCTTWGGITTCHCL